MLSYILFQLGRKYIIHLTRSFMPLPRRHRTVRRIDMSLYKPETGSDQQYRDRTQSIAERVATAIQQQPEDVVTPAKKRAFHRRGIGKFTGSNIERSTFGLAGWSGLPRLGGHRAKKL